MIKLIEPIILANRCLCCSNTLTREKIENKYIDVKFTCNNKCFILYIFIDKAFDFKIRTNKYIVYYSSGIEETVKMSIYINNHGKYIDFNLQVFDIKNILINNEMIENFLILE